MTTWLAGGYLPIKYLHMSAAAASLTLYLLRGYWLFADSAWQRSLIARRLPHWNDALLLTLGLLLATILQQFPGTHAWLTAKLTALLVHIGLGFVAFRAPLTLPWRLAAWFGSLAAFGYIVAVALTRRPWPF